QEGWLPPKVAQAALAGCGLGLSGAGGVAVFVSDNGAGTAALLVAGAILVALALLWDRVESIGWGEAEIRMRGATELLARSREADAEGETDLADELLDVAGTLLS